MRRTQEVGEILYDQRRHRMLVIEADDLEEWTLLLDRARTKGWHVYQEGKAPQNRWYSAWMVKLVADGDLNCN